MKIIKATGEHLSEIIELNKIVDYHNPDSFMEESVILGRVFVVIEDNHVLGFLLYQELWGNTILLSLLKVHSDVYQKGIGTKLLDTFEKYLREQGIDTYMSSTMPDNKGAQTFHEKKGFKHIGILDMHYGDEIFYRKSL